MLDPRPLPADSLITPEDVLSWRPCSRYRDADRADYLDPCALLPLTPLEMTDRRRIPQVPAVDRLWVLLRPEVIPERTLRLLVSDYTERALRRERAAGRDPDTRSWAAVEATRRHARGEISDEELVEAAEGAEAASRAAINANRRPGAFRLTASESAACAAWATAISTAAMAAGYARSAAWADASARNHRAAAAEAAEARWQLKRVRQVLRGGYDA